MVSFTFVMGFVANTQAPPLVVAADAVIWFSSYCLVLVFLAFVSF